MSAIPVPDCLCGPVLALSELVCYESGATFASRTALAVHSRILHGSVNDADQRVVGTVCLRCRKQLHSRPRLVAHLAAYFDHVPPLDSTCFQELEKEDALIRRKRKDMGLTDLHAVLPVVKNAGPRLPPPLPDILELCRARPGVPRLQGHCDDEHERVPCISPPCTTCMQITLCPFGGNRKEGDFQTQIERIVAKEGRTVAVLSLQGDASCFNLEFWMSLIRANRVRALYISVPMHSWNEVSGSAQQLRSVDRVWSENGLSLASCQVLLYTSLPSLNEVVDCCPSRLRCQGDHQHHAINVLTTVEMLNTSQMSCQI